MTELEAVKTKLEELRLAEMRLESENFKTKITPMVKAAIGKTYVYRNNTYGHGGKWDTFRKLLDVVFSEYHALLIYEKCQIDDSGIAQIELDTDLVHRYTQSFPPLERCWEECAPAEYAAQRRAVLCELSDPVRAREELRKR